MKLYVINLDRSPDRLSRLDAIFAALGLKLTRVRAFDAKYLDNHDYERLTAQRLWPEALTRGEVACFLSHRQALQLIANGNDPYGVIFEDDVILAPHAAYFLNNTDWVPKDADIIKLETFNKKVWLGPPQPTPLENFSLGTMKSTHIMAAAYLISKPAAQQFLTHMDYATAPFDHLLFNYSLKVATQFKIYQLDPAIAVQAKLESTLQGERAENDSGKKKKRTLAQTIKREFRRIFKRARIGIWGIGINIMTKDRWKRVSFSNMDQKDTIENTEITRPH